MIWFGWVLWHINLCRLFNAKSCLYIYIKYIYKSNIYQYSRYRKKKNKKKPGQEQEKKVSRITAQGKKKKFWGQKERKGQPRPPP